MPLRHAQPPVLGEKGTSCRQLKSQLRSKTKPITIMRVINGMGCPEGLWDLDPQIQSLAWQSPDYLVVSKLDSALQLALLWVGSWMYDFQRYISTYIMVQLPDFPSVNVLMLSDIAIIFSGNKNISFLNLSISLKYFCFYFNWITVAIVLCHLE